MSITIRAIRPPARCPGAPAPLIKRIHGSAASSAYWHLVARWARRRGQRRALAELARLPQLLDDIGLTRAQALREAAKPFWRR